VRLVTPEQEMQMRRMRWILVLTFVLAVTACGGNGTTQGDPTSGDDSAGGEALTVQAQDNEFDPGTLEASAGEIAVQVKNSGEAPHTFTVQELGVDETVDPGATAEVTFEAEAGTYEYVCRFHPGMTGSLDVS
jgi:plastocyanin